MSSKNTINSPEKHDQLTSAIVNTSTHSGDVNLNVVLNRLNQPHSVSSVSSDSDIELIPPEIIAQRQTNSKKSYSTVLFQIRSDVGDRKVTTAGLQTERKQLIALT